MTDGALEEHAQEEQPATQEDRGEQPVLDLADLFAHHADEPQEGDAGERHQIQAEPNQGPSLRSDSSDRRVSSDKAMRIIVMAASSNTANTIPARAADRRLRQNEAVSRGASVITALGPTDRNGAAGVRQHLRSLVHLQPLFQASRRHPRCCPRSSQPGGQLCSVH